MGIGQRILGIANNFPQGLAHRAPVVNTGSGATNGQFNQDLDAYHRDTQGKVTRTPNWRPDRRHDAGQRRQSSGSDKPVGAG